MTVRVHRQALELVLALGIELAQLSVEAFVCARIRQESLPEEPIAKVPSVLACPCPPMHSE